MKRAIAVLFVVLLFTSIAFADRSGIEQVKVDRAIELLSKSLDADNEGVRNSALCQLARIKVMYPDADMKKVAKKVGHLASRDESKIIRINASIAYTILSDKLDTEKLNATTVIPNDFFSDAYHTIIK